MKFITGYAVEIDIQEQAGGGLTLRLPRDAANLTAEDREGFADLVRGRTSTDLRANVHAFHVATIREFVDVLFGKFAPLFSAKPEQPAPVPNGGTPIWELVVTDVATEWNQSDIRDALIRDMRERDRIGRERYGTPLQAHNGRDALLDAYQEALDGVVYMRQWIEEYPDDRAVSMIYKDFMDLTYRLRGVLARRST